LVRCPFLASPAKEMFRKPGRLIVDKAEAPAVKA